MPERFNELINHMSQPIGFALLGIVLAIGQHLKNQEPWIWSVVIGRAICTGGVAMSAGAVLVWVPDLPLWGQIGVAAALASIGTAGLERLIIRVLQGRGSA